jgi:hypothetical protein
MGVKYYNSLIGKEYGLKLRASSRSAVQKRKQTKGDKKMKRILAGLCVLVVATSAHAASRTWVADRVGDFNVGTNWTTAAGVPVAGDILRFQSGTAYLTSATNGGAGYNTMMVSVGTGNIYSSLNMLNSKLITTNTFYLGHSSTNTTSVFSMTNSTLTIGGAGHFYAGYTGYNQTNTVNLKNSTVDTTGSSAGFMYIAGGAVGYSKAVVNMDGSTFKANGIALAYGTNADVTLNMTGSVLSAKGDIAVGVAAAATGATGTLNVVNSTIEFGKTISDYLQLGTGSNGLGVLNMKNSSATGGSFRLGVNGAGVMNMDGGTLSVTNLHIASYGGTGSSMMSVSNGATISAAWFSLSGGTQTGTLSLAGADISFNVAGNVIGAAGGTFAFSVLDTNGFSTINSSSGIVSIDQSALNITLNGNSLTGLGNLTLFSGSSVTGKFSSVLIDGLDGSDKVIYGADYIALIPEPTTVGLFIVSSVGLILARRVRSY